MANTVSILSYNNTFGDWIIATNALAQENNTLAANNYHKNSGTLYLDTNSLALQANGSAIFQQGLTVSGTGSYASIQNSLTVGQQLYLTNTSLSIVSSGQIRANGVGTSLSVSNNAIFSGNVNILGSLTLNSNNFVSDSLNVKNSNLAASANVANTLNNNINSINTNIGNKLSIINGTSGYATANSGNVSFTSTNGVTANGSGSTITINTAQDIRVNASPILILANSTGLSVNSLTGSLSQSTANTTNIGFLNIPQNIQNNTNYTLSWTDAGGHIYRSQTSTSANTIIIPQNSAIPFPLGTAVTFVNDTSAGLLTISCSDTVMLSPSGNTTNPRYLAANGIATVMKVTPTRWIISGSNLT